MFVITALLCHCTVNLEITFKNLDQSKNKNWKWIKFGKFTAVDHLNNELLSADVYGNLHCDL